jgi:hypothetical protein
MRNCIISFAIVCFFTACTIKTGSGNIQVENRNTDMFTSIDIGGDLDVEIKKGANSAVSVEADDNLIDDVVTTASNGQLKVHLKSGVSYRDLHIKLIITTPMQVEKISSSASARVMANDLVKWGDKIYLSASSGSSIKATVDAPNIEGEASSGADLELNGRTRVLKLEASSGATLKAMGLLSENTVVNVSSGANATVHASVMLDAKASSGATVSYKGNPSVSKKESSGGSVYRN